MAATGSCTTSSTASNATASSTRVRTSRRSRRNRSLPGPWAEAGLFRPVRRRSEVLLADDVDLRFGGSDFTARDTAKHRAHFVVAPGDALEQQLRDARGVVAIERDLAASIEV